MATINFFIKTDYIDKSGQAPVICEFSHKGKLWRHNPDIKVNPKEVVCIYDNDLDIFKLSIIGSGTSAMKEQLKGYSFQLMEIHSKISKALDSLKTNNIEPTIENVKAEYNKDKHLTTPNIPSQRFARPVIDWYQEFIETKESEIGVGIQSYKAAYEHFRKFVETKGVILFQDITREFLIEFRKFLKPLGFSGPTIYKTFKNLRGFINWVVDQDENGELKLSAAYKKVSLKTRYGDPIGLSSDQFIALYNLDLSDSIALDKTRDMFVFGVSIGGPRHKDLEQIGESLRKNGFSVNQNVLTYFESKTGNAHSEIVMNRFGMQVLKKYKGMFPIVPNNYRMNKHLKCIATRLNWDETKSIPHYDEFGKLVKVVEIPLKKIFSTKFMRKTAATLDNMLGVPVKTSMKRTGHKTFAAYSRYVDVNRETLQDANKQWDNFMCEIVPVVSFSFFD